jgi:RHS repeat-associated protein
MPNEDVDKDGTKYVFDMRFPGQRYDAVTGLFQNGWRDYDPASGRYVQSDPIGLAGGISTYAYVGSNPYGRVDPFGLAWQYSFALNFTVISPSTGFSVNLGAGVNIDGWNSKGFNQVQVNVADPGSSRGLFVGLGPVAGIGKAASPTTGLSQSDYMEGNAAFALGAGGSATKGACNSIDWGFTRGGKIGPGAGIGGFSGKSYSATLVGPTLGRIFGVEE